MWYFLKGLRIGGDKKSRRAHLVGKIEASG